MKKEAEKTEEKIVNDVVSKPKQSKKSNKKSDVLKDEKLKSKKTDSKVKKTLTEKETSKKDTLKETKASTKKSVKKVNNETDINSKDKKPKQASSRTKKAVKSNSSTVKSMLSEYYDLPYRYNQTMVKILAQTPTTLFVYWDISDEDKSSLVSKYGDNFFYDTIPVLVIHNTTKNYSYEIEINDFANSWYIRTSEADCNYIIELGRKFKNQYENNYVYINSSNNMVSPNDHVLFENVNLSKVLFKNTKTNELLYKDFSSLNNAKGIDRLYNNIYDIYGSLYADEDLQSINAPSSSVFYLQGVKK